MIVKVEIPVTGPGAEPRLDTVADEVPVAFEYNGIAHAVMLASPADLEDFALGFSLSEGIVQRGSDVYAVEVTQGAEGITLHLEIASAAFANLKQRRRSMAGRTGCGLCGVDSLAQVMRDLAPVHADDFPLAALYDGIRVLPMQQLLQQATGAAHAACRIGSDGSISHVREDVGRHNALDKAVGEALTRKASFGDSFVLLSGRMSFEMVAKAARAGISDVAAVSAPTALAVELAKQLGMFLAGFARGRSAVIYSGNDALLAE